MKRSDIVGLHRIKNKPSRNAFDLSHRHMFTAQIGELLPIFNTWVNPGDTLKLGYNGLSRTAPLQTAAFTRLKENVQYYFVPFQSLWKYFEQVVNNMTEGNNGQNISKFAEDFSSPETLGTSLPYVTTEFLCSCINNLLNMTIGEIYKCYNSFKSTSKDVTDISLYIDRLNNLTVLDNYKVMVNGVFRYSLVCKLLNYFGYGNFPLMHYDMLSSFIAWLGTSPSTVTPNAFKESEFGFVPAVAPASAPNLSILPLLAYHKIVNDHYRYMQWQSFEPWTCNIDFITPSSSMAIDGGLSDSIYGLNSTIFDMEFSNLSLDYFLGVLPKAQYGEESSVAFGVNSISAGNIVIDNPEIATDDVGINFQSGNAHSVKVKGTSPESTSSPLYVNSGNDEITMLTGRLRDSTGSSSELKISALRSAIALQKYKEVQGSNDSDFAAQVLAHFGVKPKTDSRVSRFIGGSDSIIDINPQINQNLAGDNDAEIKAIATGDLSAGCKFTADTYGIVIGIYRCVPQLDLAHVGIDRQLLKTDASDFVIPELDSIGMQTQYRFELAYSAAGFPRKDSQKFSYDSWSGSSYGYAPRYCEYKVSFDRVDGAFNGVLSSWVTGYDFDLLQKWSAGDAQISKLLTCRPSICYPIFQEQISNCVSNDKIFVGSVNTCVAVRNLSVHGLPYTK